jgi:hypothetical protein
MTFRRKPLASAVALVTLLCAAPAATQTPQATVAGVVRDATGLSASSLVWRPLPPSADEKSGRSGGKAIPEPTNTSEFRG